MSEYNSIVQALKAPKDKKNDFGKYSYRNAESILELVKPLLNELECELMCRESINQVGDRYYVEIHYSLYKGDEILAEASGFAREQENKSGMDAAQITGAATSYAKKYALCNLFHIDDSRLDPDEELMSRLQKQMEEEKKKQGQDTTTTSTTTTTTTTTAPTTTTTTPKNQQSEEDIACLVLECKTVNEAKEYLKANKIDIKKYPGIQAELNKKFNLK